MNWPWFRRNGREGDRRLQAWKASWDAAAAAADASRAPALRAELEAMGLSDDDMEIEREMLDALDELGALTADVLANGLPAIETGHRVVGTERCHFTAPVSMPDEVSQPSGRLLLTSGRAIFVGGANGAAVPWHSVADTRHLERDVVLIRGDRERLYRFRCNSFGDALRAAFLARQLMAAGRRRTPVYNP